MYTLKKTFHFVASRRILPITEEPSELGKFYAYEVTLELSGGALDRYGKLADLADLGRLGDHIEFHFNEEHLNNVGILKGSPTLENLAVYFLSYARKLWPDATAVTVSDAENGAATYRVSPSSWAIQEGYRQTAVAQGGNIIGVQQIVRAGR